ncbi:hypothetical protein N868_04535 [Cellulomonas carbonis T26]|uniref:Uncharacterized protein n=1 Tax=Cellulomonas carbonis T26 TaxID=947969 RepID=A0A0A0BM93_9CELL|nr:hypothetical protein N868_04535 [Cellulomonas carbonis T26]
MAAGVAGTMGVAGLGLAAAASAAEDDGSSTTTGRVEAIRDALADLVDDGTLTDEQADRVAETLDGSAALAPGRGGGMGPGFGHSRGLGLGHARGLALDVAAETLGLTTDDLRTALAEDGATLASVAQAQGVDEDALVAALVAAATEHLAAAVEEGRLTQEEADERAAQLTERFTALVDQEAVGGVRMGDGTSNGRGNGMGMGVRTGGGNGNGRGSDA